MLEIINLPIIRFKSIQLRNMKPYLLLLLSVFSMNAFGQTRNLRTELGIAYGSYLHANNLSCNGGYINSVMETEIDFSSFDEVKWYSDTRHIRNYEVTGAKRLHQSKNLRREFYLGSKLAGQFQHRTLFIGTKETLEEEMLIDQKTGRVRKSYSFETTALSELNDYLNLSPYGSYRLLLNDFFSVQTALSTGILIPIRTGVQETSYQGELTREQEGEVVLSEFRKYKGELDFEWHKAVFKPRMRFEASILVEIKPIAKKPYYLTVGSLIGRQVNFGANSDFSYKGLRIGLQSQF